MKIEIGEFVRTKNGYIGKLHKISTYKINNKNKTMYLVKFNIGSYGINITDITKHSENLIDDLIEQGDYVNGYIVKRMPDFDNKLCNFDLNIMKWVPLEDIYIDGLIENIVTHEQFERMKYKVEE